MSQPIEELLQQCTVKLGVPGGYGHGTGFFVAPGLILTCAHVVKSLKDDEFVTVRWQNQENFAQATLDQRLPGVDLALLRCTPSDETLLPCVYLDESIKAGDELYLFGYPDQDFDNGCPVTFTCEGLTGDASPLIKFKLGQVRPGMSGSPLLNLRTGKVCGIVKFTRDRSFDLGGGAIPTSIIFEEVGKLKKLQQSFHKRDRRWRNLLVGYKRPSVKLAALSAIGVTALVTAIRCAGLLQGAELWAYDWLMRSKPNEESDKRIALVTITADDIEQLGTTEISDRKLQQLLKQILEANPHSIGIDIFRDEKQADPEDETRDEVDYDTLIQYLESSPQMTLACYAVDSPVPGSRQPSEQVQTGFSNITNDDFEQGSPMRRQLISMRPNPQASCQAQYSLAYQVVLTYLQDCCNISETRDKNNYIQLGQVALEPVWSDTGGYQNINDSGYQILLNYRRVPFDTVTASELLDGLSAEEKSKLEDRIVFVGYDETEAPEQLDMFNTPLGEMPGVNLHGHMASHLLSITRDDEYAHPMIRTWAEPEEIIWILLWSILGGSLPLLVRSFSGVILTTAGGTILIIGVCWGVFAFGGWWLPLIPTAVGLILASAIVASLANYLPVLKNAMQFAHE